ncbi:MAG: type II toxin-antitoxin system VapC family toxin [Acidobacteriota bacterium]
MSATELPLYLDTSALLPYYREEPLSQRTQALLRNPGISVVITELIRLEIASTLGRAVKTGDMTEAEAAAVQAKFMEHVAVGYYRITTLKARHYQIAEEWLLLRKAPLGSLDSLHLACAAIEKLELVTADPQLAKSAGVFGVSCRLLTP